MYGQIECPFCSKAVRSPLNHPHTYNRSKAWDCLPGASPRATELPYSSADGKAVYRGLEERKKPNGEGKQVSQRKGRRGTRDAKSRNDPEQMERETGEPDDAKVSRPVRRGARRKGRQDLARSLPYSDTAFHAAEGDPANLKLCQRGEWQDRMLVETVLSMLTLVCHFKRIMHRVWEYFHARLAFTMAAFNVLVQWHGLQPNMYGFVPLSIDDFSL